jgi:hypothetical protein
VFPLFCPPPACIFVLTIGFACFIFPGWLHRGLSHNSESCTNMKLSSGSCICIALCFASLEVCLQLTLFWNALYGIWPSSLPSVPGLFNDVFSVDAMYLRMVGRQMKNDDLQRSCRSLFLVISWHCLERLKKATKNLRRAGVPGESLTDHLPNTSPERYL